MKTYLYTCFLETYIAILYVCIRYRVIILHKLIIIMTLLCLLYGQYYKSY